MGKRSREKRTRLPESQRISEGKERVREEERQELLSLVRKLGIWAYL